jgi:lipid A 4'-phosphatase
MLAPNASPEPDERRGISALGLLKNVLCIGISAFLFFRVFPDLDMKITRFFYSGDGQFIGNHMRVFAISRQFFNIVFYLICGIAVIGLVVTGRTARAWLGLGFSKWVFLVLCLLIGPLVVTNIGLKDHWGRARPRDVIEFGGTKAFTPPFPAAEQCDYNCSFVSGEASSIFIVFFAGGFLFRSNARKIITVGIVLGSLAGLTRIAQGGHFLSDVVFAGIFMALTAGAVQLLFDIIRSASRAELAEAAEKTSL